MSPPRPPPPTSPCSSSSHVDGLDDHGVGYVSASATQAAGRARVLAFSGAVDPLDRWRLSSLGVTELRPRPRPAASPRPSWRRRPRPTLRGCPARASTIIRPEASAASGGAHPRRALPPRRRRRGRGATRAGAVMFSDDARRGTAMAPRRIGSSLRHRPVGRRAPRSAWCLACARCPRPPSPGVISRREGRSASSPCAPAPRSPAGWPSEAFVVRCASASPTLRTADGVPAPCPAGHLPCLPTLSVPSPSA